MFNIQNPKKTITLNFSLSEVKNSILRVPVVSANKYKFTESNDIINQITLETLEFLSLGVFIDLNLNELNDTKTEITIEVRRKIGSFDTSVEINNASLHINNITKFMSDCINLSDTDFEIKYDNNIKNIKNELTDSKRVWYTQQYIPNTLIIMGIISLPIIIGFGLLAFGIYAKVERNKILKQK